MTAGRDASIAGRARAAGGTSGQPGGLAGSAGERVEGTDSKRWEAMTNQREGWKGRKGGSQQRGQTAGALTPPAAAALKLVPAATRGPTLEVAVSRPVAVVREGPVAAGRWAVAQAGGHRGTGERHARVEVGPWGELWHVPVHWRARWHCHLPRQWGADWPWRPSVTWLLSPSPMHAGACAEGSFFHASHDPTWVLPIWAEPHRRHQSRRKMWPDCQRRRRWSWRQTRPRH